MKESSNSSDKKAEEENKNEETEIELESPNCIISFARAIYRSSYFDYLIDGSIFLQSIIIVLKQANDPEEEVVALNAVENACFACYLLEVLLGCLSDGVEKFLKKSKSNVISFGITFVIIATFIPYGNFIINNYLRRITIVKIFTLFRKTNK